MFYGRTLFTHPINTSLHLLIPASHSSRLLPTSHLAATSPFFMSLTLFHRKVRLCHILGSTYKWYHRLFVFLFLTYSVYCDDMVMFGVGAFGRWLGLDLVHSLCLSLPLPNSSLFSHLCFARTEGETGHHEPGRGLLLQPSPTASLISDSSHGICEKINVCGLSLHVNGVLLRQPDCPKMP